MCVLRNNYELQQKVKHFLKYRTERQNFSFTNFRIQMEIFLKL